MCWFIVLNLSSPLHSRFNEHSCLEALHDGTSGGGVWNSSQDAELARCMAKDQLAPPKPMPHPSKVF